MTERLSLEPIGVFRTPYRDKYEAPRQPAPKATGDSAWIELFPRRNYEQALSDLDGFERIWVLFWFHKAGHWNPKVLPPRGRTKRGLFATRSPHRPNPIGMSVLRLLEIRGLRLYVETCDTLDGTPVLDIKPYIPLYDSFSESSTGWLALEEAAERHFQIVFSELAHRQCEFLSKRGAPVAEIASQTLTREPLPHPYRRTKLLRQAGENAGNEALYEIAVRSWRLRYRLRETTVFIENARSGYAREIIATWDKKNAPKDAADHRDFCDVWGENN